VNLCINIASEQKKHSSEKVMARLRFYLQPLLHHNLVKNLLKKRSIIIKIAKKIVIQLLMKTFKWIRTSQKYFKLQKVKKANKKKENVILSKNKNKYKNNNKLRKTEKTLKKILLIILVTCSYLESK
jgi:hypothetical protein